MSGMSRQKFEFEMRKMKYQYEEQYQKSLRFIELQKTIIEELRIENQNLKRRIQNVQKNKEI